MLLTVPMRVLWRQPRLVRICSLDPWPRQPQPYNQGHRPIAFPEIRLENSEIDFVFAPCEAFPTRLSNQGAMTEIDSNMGQTDQVEVISHAC